MPGTATTILIDGTPTNGSDAWIDSLVGGGAWTDGNGGPVTIQWTAFQGTMDGQASYSWTSLALTGLREAMSLWESVANIDFVEVASAADADVKFWWGTQAQAGGPNVLGWSDLPGYSDSEVLDVLFNAQDSSMAGPLGKGSLGLVTMVHEIGHLLGLAHPHDGGAGSDRTKFPGVGSDPYSYGTGGLNQGIYTTMSYNFGWPSFTSSLSEFWGLQYGPMAFDIAAIQAIYGVNMNYASGGNVYKLPTSDGPGAYWSSIWDTGGIDTISNEGSSNAAIIDLRAAGPGSLGGGNVSYAFVDLSGGPIINGGYTIARNVTIENAIGGSGRDTLTGNAAVNRLEGGAGWDTLDGGAGADTMIGGTGWDTYYVDNTGDVIVEFEDGGEIDTVHSSLANFTLGAFVENLNLSGINAVNGAGNGLANVIVGNSNSNVLRGGGGGDSLSGLEGNDRLIVDDVSFALVDGGAATDTLALGGAGLVLDLTLPANRAKVVAIERIDLTGTGNNTLKINAPGLSGIGESVGGKRILVVERDLGDIVQFADPGWTKVGTLSNADGAFDRWVSGTNEIHLEQVETHTSGTSYFLETLDGSTGFRISGASYDFVGTSVASAGDVNGDGFADLIIGAESASPNGFVSGATYVVFGKASGFAAQIDLSTVNGSNGFKLNGAAAYDRTGRSVASAGDINGDGFDDLIIGAYGAETGAGMVGTSYVVFGKASGFAATINLSSLSAGAGFKLNGGSDGDRSGWSVAGMADFNGDGFSDLIIGATDVTAGDVASGAAYVVFGKASGFAANINLSALNGTTGFRFGGNEAFGGAGYSVASADVNGDGYDDLIVGNANRENTGGTYVLFGKASGFAANVGFGSLNGINGFKLSNVDSDGSRTSVASAGDVNGDGFEDIFVGARYADAHGQSSGASFVVFGKASGFAADFDLSGLNGINGFKLSGGAAEDLSGFSVASAGDINGDGYGDLIVGAPLADAYGTDAGVTYVVFGKASGFAADLDLSTLDSSAGFKLAGTVSGMQSGRSVASAGDINGDGYDDLIVGVPHAASDNVSSGTAYVVFGGAFGGTVKTNGTAAAEILIGGAGNDTLRGNGGGDVFHGGAGNDRLVVTDLAFRLADGGDGTDTLTLNGAGLSLDLSNPLVAARLQGIERIDLSGTGDNTLTVSKLSVLSGVGAVAGGKHILVVERDFGDKVQFAESNWTKTGSFSNSVGTFDRWVFGNVEVHIEQIAAPPIVGLTELDGSDGFKLSSAEELGRSGWSVASAGDINGDGFDDLIIGSRINYYDYESPNESYVVFGKASGFAPETILTNLDGIKGFTLVGETYHSGMSVASAGDVNGDGFDDLIVGDPNIVGGSAVVFGKASGFGARFDLASLDGSNGFKVKSADFHDLSGYSVASAGDVNGDGFDDIIIGTAAQYGALISASGQGASTAYVVFGKAAGFAADLNLATLNGSNGFKFTHVLRTDNTGVSVASAGDVNGDGYADLIVGAPHADPNGNNSGATYVVFGKASGFGASFALSGLNGSNGFKLSGVDFIDFSGGSVASAGDVNGDGFDDIIIGARNARASSESSGDYGVSYVVFGKASGFAANINLSTLNGSNGFKLNGDGYSQYSGFSVASAGDFNGDGFDDLIIGAPSGEGAAYVVFGHATGFAASVDLKWLNGSDGFKLRGAEYGASGFSVASAGDVNGDGFDDLIFGAPKENTNHATYSGASYVVFGGAVGGVNVPVTTTGTTAAEILIGGRGNDVLTGGGGIDVFRAGTGNDRLIVRDLAFRIADGGGGTDTLVLAGTGLTLDLTNPLAAAKLKDIERIDLTGTGNNTLVVNEFAVLGGPGSVAGGRHVLVVEGNAGDIVSMGVGDWLKTSSYTDATGTFDRWVSGNAQVDVEREIAITGLPTGPVTIIGTAANDLISTTVSVPGQPTATGFGDTIDGGGGADSMAGGRGDDTYHVDTPLDAVIEAADAGTDRVFASASYSLSANVENLILTGTDDIDATGNSLANILTGNAGDNVIDGAAGADTMLGGMGDDTYVVDVAGDVVTELAAEGTDAVNAWVSWTLGANFEQLRLLGTGDLNGTGNNLTNALFGNAGKNLLNGGAGADTMTGGLGDDTYIVDNAGDVIVEAVGGGIDLVQASVSFQLGVNIENLVLTGNSSVNGTGNELANVLTGNGGKNVLDGGAGADTMAGAGGDDSYVVDNAGDVVTELVGAGVDTVLASVDWTLSANVEKVTLAGTANLAATGNELANTLTGNVGNNRLNGGAGADTMAGGLGDDTYVVDVAGDIATEGADQGTDTVEAWLSWTLGANFEQLKLMGVADLNGTGNASNNALFGNAGRNVLDGGAGADAMTGGTGDDTYYIDNAGDVVVELAGGGIDSVVAWTSWTLAANVEKLTLAGTGKFDGTGNGLNNTLTGNVNKNTLDGGAGADTMAGGLGNDTYVVDSVGDVVIEAEGEGSDIVLASIGYTLGSHVERLILTGAAHLNGTGNGLANVLYGNDGNNVLDGKAGADLMSGGVGDDTYIVDDAGDDAIEDAAAGVDTVQSSVSWRLGANFERLILTGLADLSGTGNSLANGLTGNVGNNLLDGGAGADAMAGGLGDDIYIVDSSDDKVTEKVGEGVDTVRSSIAYMLRANVEKLVLTGSAAISGVGNADANVIVGNAAANLLDGRTGADTMEGGAGDDVYVVDNAGDVVIEAANGGSDEVQSSISYALTANVERLKLVAAGNLDITGNGLDNTLTGNAGNNVLDGGLGADAMSGGAGDDIYIVDNARDVVFESGGAGTDTVLASVSHALRVNVENLVLTGAASVKGEGNAANNIITGNDAGNFLNGGAGADTMKGGGGDDTYMVDNAGDIVVELAGGGTDEVRAWIDYQLGANVEKLALYGIADIDGTGNDLVNVVTGNAGHNVLDGGLGSDLLVGGGGGDTFRFSTTLGPDNVDRIRTFDHAADTIQLDDSVFVGLDQGGLSAGAFALGAVATQADDRILFHAASKSLYYDADGVGGVAAVKFATIDILTGTLDHNDFLIV